jgi:hypothetical protein
MSSASLDRLLAILLAAMAASGLLTLRSGSADSTWVYVLHGVLAGALLSAVLVKLRRSFPRAARAGRRVRLALGSLVVLLVSSSIGAGYLWVAAGHILRVDVSPIGSVTVLTLHVWLGIAVAPVLLLHLLPRRWRLLRPGARSVSSSAGRLLSRRSVLTGLGLGAVGLSAFTAANTLDQLAGGSRRFTGSRSLEPADFPPVTTFFGEGAPSIDAAAWRLTVSGRVARPRSLRLEELRELGQTDLRATLDCTSGWALETTWRGVPMTLLLDAAGLDPAARSIEVRSVTGWGSVFSLAEAEGLLLATSVGGGPLPAGNGAPCRVVAPDRRGLDWVKWIDTVRVS